MKKALVIGAGGFIGHNLVKRLKEEGWYVVGVDLKYPQYGKSEADEFLVNDIKNVNIIRNYDRIYQLAADMGGAGFVFTGDNDADILTNSLSINLHVLQELKKANYKGTVFYSSSVCAYPDEVEGKETDAYPAHPPSNYGWEKLTSERLYLAYAKNYGVDTRIARFHNTFGPYGTYKGGREKSPAAVCRKVIEAKTGISWGATVDEKGEKTSPDYPMEQTGEIEIWGNGEQLRPFIYIDDLLDGIEALMQSNLATPVNLGPSEGITINELVDKVCAIAGKSLNKKYIEGPTGGAKRYANNDLAKSALGWSPKWGIDEGLRATYEWISEQMK